MHKLRSINCLRLLLALALTASGSAVVADTTPPTGGAVLVEPAANSEEGKRLNSIRNQDNVRRVILTNLTSAMLSQPQLTLTLPGEPAATFNRVSVDKRPDGSVFWTGASSSEKVDGRPRDIGELSVAAALPDQRGSSADRGIAGFVRWKGIHYDISTLKPGVAMVIDYDEAKRRAAHPSNWEKLINSNGEGRKPNNPSSSPTSSSAQGLLSSTPLIRVLFAITPQAAQKLGANANAAVTGIVSRANQILSNSGISDVQISSAGISYRAYDLPSIVVALERKYSLELMQDRDAANADLTVVIGNYSTLNDGCGIAEVAPPASSAIAFVHVGCSDLGAVVTHEIGHFAGGTHPVEISGYGGQFPYGHGYFFRNPSTLYPGKAYCVGTIMALNYRFPNLTNCIADSYGNPDQTGGGNASVFSATTSNPSFPGVVIGNSASADMVRLVKERAPILASYRATRLADGFYTRAIIWMSTLFR